MAEVSKQLCEKMSKIYLLITANLYGQAVLRTEILDISLLRLPFTEDEERGPDDLPF